MSLLLAESIYKITKGAFSFLLGTEDTVAGIAQTGDNVSMLIQLLVDGSDVQIHIGMCLGNSLNAFGTADDVHHDDALAAVLFQEIDSSDCRAAGSQHGVNHINLTGANACPVRWVSLLP